MFLDLDFWMGFGLIWEESLVSRSLAFWDESPLFGVSSSGIVLFFLFAMYVSRCLEVMLGVDVDISTFRGPRSP